MKSGCSLNDREPGAECGNKSSVAIHSLDISLVRNAKQEVPAWIGQECRSSGRFVGILAQAKKLVSRSRPGSTGSVSSHGHGCGSAADQCCCSVAEARAEEPVLS